MQVLRLRQLSRRLTPFSSRAANGLLMLLTNLLTCSKCLVISVARTMSIMACRRVLYSFLERERERWRYSMGRIQMGARWENGERWQCGKQHGEACEQFLHSDYSDSGDEWLLCLLPPPLRGAAHVSHSAWGFKSHYSSTVRNTQEYWLCRLIFRYQQFLQNLNRENLNALIVIEHNNKILSSHWIGSKTIKPNLNTSSVRNMLYSVCSCWKEHSCPERKRHTKMEHLQLILVHQRTEVTW